MSFILKLILSTCSVRTSYSVYLNQLAQDAPDIFKLLAEIATSKHYHQLLVPYIFTTGDIVEDEACDQELAELIKAKWQLFSMAHQASPLSRH